jgi:cytoskeletal protein CcmA (bactofilin family)
LSEPKRESILIDPRAMNVVNRIAVGGHQSGTYRCAGGLLVQGSVQGEIEVTGGPLILMPEGLLAGTIKCDGEAYLFGTIAAQDNGAPSELDVQGVVFMAETLVAKANVTAGGIKTFQGTQVDGRINTVRRDGTSGLKTEAAAKVELAAPASVLEAA